MRTVPSRFAESFGIFNRASVHGTVLDSGDSYRFFAARVFEAHLEWHAES